MEDSTAAELVAAYEAYEAAQRAEWMATLQETTCTRRPVEASSS